MNRKTMGLVLVAGMVLGAGSSIMAEQLLEKVTAYKNPSIQFTLDGNEFAEDATALVYDNHVYLPVRAVGEGLGYDVEYSKNAAKFTTPGMEIEKVSYLGTVVELTESQIICITPNSENSIENQLILNVSDDTIITLANKTKGELSDLAIGDTLQVETPAIRTFSIPAQTSALEIQVVSSDAVVEQATVPFEASKIVAIEDSTIIIEFNGAELHLKTDKDTFVHHKINKRAYTVADLEVGQTITGVISAAMTASYPAQAYAHEIVLN